MKKTLVIFIFLVFILLIGISLKFGISIGKFRVASIEETIKSYNDLQNENTQSFKIHFLFNI